MRCCALRSAFLKLRVENVIIFATCAFYYNKIKLARCTILRTLELTGAWCIVIILQAIARLSTKFTPNHIIINDIWWIFTRGTFNIRSIFLACFATLMTWKTLFLTILNTLIFAFHTAAVVGSVVVNHWRMATFPASFNLRIKNLTRRATGTLNFWAWIKNTCGTWAV